MLQTFPVLAISSVRHATPHDSCVPESANTLKKGGKYVVLIMHPS